MPASDDQDQTRTTLYTDVSAREAGIRERHRAVVEEIVRRIGAVEASAAGDGLQAVLAEPERALICAVQIQRSFEEWGSSQPAAPVRAGLSCEGDPDAAHVAARARNGEILVTERVRALGEPRGHLFSERGELRHGAGSTRLHAVRWWEHD